MEKKIDFADSNIDWMEPEKRKKLLEELIQEQVRYAYKTTEIYKRQFDKIGLKLENIKTIEDFRENVPILTKENLRTFGMYGLLPKIYQEALDKSQREFSLESRIYKIFSTSGSTGKPTNSFYTKKDWKNSIDLVVRSLNHIPSEEYKVLFNGFHPGHIGGPLINDGFCESGAVVVPRHFRADDKAALQQIKDYNCNAIMAPPHSVAGKGGSIEALVERDIENLFRKQIKTVIYAGSSMKKELSEILRELGIKNIFSFYGSSEVIPAAAECQANEGMHLMQIPNLIEIIDLKSGEHVLNGERGRVIVTALNRQASQFIRYDLGDEATFIDEPCSCGRTTPRIKDIKRVEDIKRLQTGCTVWE